MQVVIYPSARVRLDEIWDYTARVWGEDQAETYLRDLNQTIQQTMNNRSRWRVVQGSAYDGVYSLRHKQHYIFFMELDVEMIAIVSVLHENMDMPSRLISDLESFY